MILWGLFKKIVIADSCAILVDDIFDHYTQYDASVLFLGLVYFAFQLYCDFSGYSDIAIGSAKLLGFRLSRNFRYPFFATNVEDFWRRWHITLTTWIRDYVFVALSISNGAGYKIKYLRNILVVFLLIGLWHGPKWTYVLWGFLFFLLFVLEYGFRAILGKKVHYSSNSTLLPSVGEIMRIGTFFALNLLILTAFRADHLGQLFGFWKQLFSRSIFVLPELAKLSKIPLLMGLIVWEWWKRDKWHGLDFDEVPVFLRWFVYVLLVFAIFYYFGAERPFLYFKF